MANHAMRADNSDGTGAEYEPDDGNLAASGGSQFVCMWVRKSDVAANTTALLYILGDNSWRMLTYRSGDNLVCNGPNYSSATWTNGNLALQDGNWHWLTFEADYSGGAGNGVWRVTCDNVVVASHASRTWTAPTSFTEFSIGGSTGIGTAEINIDDVPVFEGHMSDAERTAAYNGGDGVKGLDDGDFANATRTFYVSFDENTRTADDAVGTAAPIAYITI